jgi:predicted permease
LSLFDDFSYASRQLRAAPGYTATAMLTLALGMGATTAIATLAHTILLMSLPVAKPEELVRVGDLRDCCVNGGLQDDWSLFSYDKYTTFRDHTPAFLELAAFQSGSSRIGVRRAGSREPAESQRIEFVSGNYFTLFGVGAFAGRMVATDDDRAGAPAVAVMNYRTWAQKYGKDPSVLGASFAMNGVSVTVVGIAPPRFFGDRLEGLPAFWVPLAAEPALDGSGGLLNLPDQDWLDLIGRTAPGTDRKALETQMQSELRQWLLGPKSTLQEAERAVVPKQTLHLGPGGAGVQQMRDEAETSLRLLLWVSAFVLLIACANVANLMLARATTRRLQTSIRAALGASVLAQLRLVLSESVLLALLGGAAGVGVAYGLTTLILHLVYRRATIAVDAMPSWPVLGFAFLVSLLTGVLFGVVPAWFAAKADPAEALRGAGRATGRTGWAQRSLVVAQAAISLVLLCAAGLLAQSLRNMQRQHFGFETRNRFIAHVDPQMCGVKPAELETFYRRLKEGLAAVPGVARVSFSLYSPMEGNNWSETIYVQGEPPPPPDSHVNVASWVRVSDGYFDTLGTRIVRGRAVTEEDTRSTAGVAVVNETFARKFFKGKDPIGRHFGILEPGHAGDFEIVGVSEDTLYLDPARPVRPMYFLGGSQWVSWTEPRYVTFEDRSHYLSAIEIESRGAVPGLEPQVRRALSAVNPDLAVIDFQSFENLVSVNFSPHTMVAEMTGLFGLVALALASVGLYGVTAYSVERRTSEIGLRMALGADRVRILGLVLGGAFRQVVVGLLIGIPATLLAGRALASQLFRVAPYDPPVLLVTILVLGGAGLLATCIPARRAALLHPTEALRTE